MPYGLIDKIIEKQRAEQELRRKQVFASTIEILEELGPKYGFSKGYIFGSVVKEGKFRRESDVDIAIFNLSNHHFFRLMAEVSGRLERDVDLYQIETMDEWLRKKIERQGVLWKKED